MDPVCWGVVLLMERWSVKERAREKGGGLCKWKMKYKLIDLMKMFLRKACKAWYKTGVDAPLSINQEH